MAAVQRVRVPVAAALLVAALLGPAGSMGTPAAAEPRATIESIMIPAAAFIPATDNVDYDNGGYNLLGATANTFVAPLSFATAEVDIRRITIYGYDDVIGQDVCAQLYRSNPAEAAWLLQGQVCTFGTSAEDPQIFYSTAIAHRHVNTAFHGSYLWLVMPAGDVRFYAVKVTYSY